MSKILLVLIIVAANTDNQTDLDDGVTYYALDNSHYRVDDAIDL